jgi:hypothetical protein
MRNGRRPPSSSAGGNRRGARSGARARAAVFDGVAERTSVVHALWGGRANLVELDVEGPAGRIEGLNLRLYDPETRQWSLHYANSRNGAMSPPVTGAFRDGRGEFIGRETLDGRDILVKFVISNMTPDSWRYEQTFSDDGGETWEVNWIAIDTLISE